MRATVREIFAKLQGMRASIGFSDIVGAWEVCRPAIEDDSDEIVIHDTSPVRAIERAYREWQKVVAKLVAGCAKCAEQVVDRAKTEAILATMVVEKSPIAATATTNEPDAWRSVSHDPPNPRDIISYMENVHCEPFPAWVEARRIDVWGPGMASAELDLVGLQKHGPTNITTHNGYWRPMGVEREKSNTCPRGIMTEEEAND